MSDPRLFCMGNPLLDMQVQKGAELLEKYHLKSNDAILAEEKHMGIYGDAKARDDCKALPGGASQNTARGAAYILEKGSVVYVGSVGKDDLAQKMKEANEQGGVRTEYMTVDDDTGACAVLITGHDRSLCTRLSAAEKFSKAHLLSPVISSLVNHAHFYYVEGYFLTHGLESTLHLAKHSVGESHKQFMLNLSAPFIPQFFKSQLDEILPYVDVLFGNESEALAYAESHELKTKDISAIAQHLAQLPRAPGSHPHRLRLAVITQGADATLVASSNGSSPRSFPVQKLTDDEIVDTNGAGDAFAAGYIAALVQGKSVELCVEQGQWLAKLCIGQLGPAYPFPKQTM